MLRRKLDGLENGAPEEINGGLLGINVGYIILKDIGQDLESNTLKFGLQGGVAFRKFTGDLGNNTDFREETFGFKESGMIGAEATIFAEVNEFRPFLKATYFDISETVDGLSGLQLMLGVEVRVDALNLN